MDNLYIVAKICNYPQIVVVPLRYIYRLDYAKSFNNRINRNQEHLLFWSSDQTKVPNFDLPISKQFHHSTDGCFNVKLLKVFGNREHAIKYQRDRRNIDPAVYNRQRLNERPFPVSRNTQKQQTKSVTQSAQKEPQPKRAKHSNEANVTTPISPLHDAVQNQIDTPPNSPLHFPAQNQLDTPPNSPLHIAAQNQLDSETDIEIYISPTIPTAAATSDISTQDIICLSDMKQHRPIKTFDVVSGRYSFKQTPKGDRVYEVEGQRFILKKDTVDRLLYYNKSPTSSNNPNIDKTFTELLLLSVFKVDDLKQNKINNDRLIIIKDFYKNRVGRDKVRMGNFEKYVKNKCCELKNMQFV